MFITECFVALIYHLSIFEQDRCFKDIEKNICANYKISMIQVSCSSCLSFEIPFPGFNPKSFIKTMIATDTIWRHVNLSFRLWHLCISQEHVQGVIGVILWWMIDACIYQFQYHLLRVCTMKPSVMAWAPGVFSSPCGSGYLWFQ